jgi:hypothetical protein
MVEKFEKQASEATDWDGEVSATLISALPSARFEVVRGLRLGAGPCAVFADGEYGGSDAFGRFVEASGSSLGFGFDLGLDLVIWGPVSGRLSFRRTFMDVKTDQAEVDGEATSLYPSVETDLGYAQFGFTMLVSLVGGGSSVLGGF